MVRRSLHRLSFKTGSKIYSLFQVDIRSSVRNDLAIAREYHIQPSELRQLQYWMYELYLEEISETNKREAKEREEQEKEQQSKMPTIPNMSQLQSKYMPNFNSSNFQIPNFSLPNI